MSICPETYRTTITYLPPTFETIACIRTDVDEQGRHRGRHHGWQRMPGGERERYLPDPDRPGYSKLTAEPFNAWLRLWSWDRGGAQGSNSRPGVEPVPCPECGTLTYPEATIPTEAVTYAGSPDAYAVAGAEDITVCFHCRLWAERIITHQAGWQRSSRHDRRLVRTIRLRKEDGSPSERLNSWADGVTGAFGGWKVTVRWDDGDQRGPASSMWDGGEIPWWLDDQFPTNAVLIGGGRR